MDRKPSHKLRLPKSLLDRIEQQNVDAKDIKLRLNPSARKDLRKTAREQKKSSKNGQQPPHKRRKLIQAKTRDVESSLPSLQYSVSSGHNIISRKLGVFPTNNHKPNKYEVEEDPTPFSDPRLSRSHANKLFKDDREIASLEKKLKIKQSQKLPQSFQDDGLDYLLRGLENFGDFENEASDIEKCEGNCLLKQKKRKAQKISEKLIVHNILSPLQSNLVIDQVIRKNKEAGVILGVDELCSGDSSENLQSIEGDILDQGSPSGIKSEDLQDYRLNPPRDLENPHLVSQTSSQAEKYIPPFFRETKSSDSEELFLLRRRTQGLINKLTESNLISILGGIENLYRKYPRQYVTSTLKDILLVSVCQSTTLPDTLIILYAGIIAAIYKVIGPDFGAAIAQSITELWDEYYAHANELSLSDPTIDVSKETSNLIMLLAELYNFQVLGSKIIFDYIRSILGDLSELNAELLLKITRASGPQLRQDDPSSLKDITVMLRSVRARVNEQSISVRTKFMIETIDDLKNNRLRTNGPASTITSEHIIRMKKILGSLNNRSPKATEPLRIGLKDIRDCEKKGKWWLVGASWSGHNTTEEIEIHSKNRTETLLPPVVSHETLDLFQLAREQRMNTDIRRLIFITIISATDYQDAYIRLKKLKLKKKQEYEIPKVLIRCAAVEKNYNPYYTLVARKFCNDRKVKMSFQYCLWDLFKRMGDEFEDTADYRDMGNVEEDLNTRNLVNLAKMFGNLVYEGCLGLSILKNLNLSYLPSKTKVFVEILFITIFLESQKNLESKRDKSLIVSIFSNISSDLQNLLIGLQYFLKEFVSNTDIADGNQEKDLIKWASKVARRTLKKAIIS